MIFFILTTIGDITRPRFTKQLHRESEMYGGLGFRPFLS